MDIREAVQINGETLRKNQFFGDQMLRTVIEGVKGIGEVPKEVRVPLVRLCMKPMQSAIRVGMPFFADPMLQIAPISFLFPMLINKLTLPHFLAPKYVTNKTLLAFIYHIQSS